MSGLEFSSHSSMKVNVQEKVSLARAIPLSLSLMLFDKLGIMNEPQ